MPEISLKLDIDTARVLLDAVIAQRAEHMDNASGAMEGSFAYMLHTGLAEELERVEGVLRDAGCAEVVQ